MNENKVVKGSFKQEIFNTVNENLKALEALFPGVIKDGEVDFRALKEELGQFEEIGEEQYGFNWAGKQQAKKIAQEDCIGKTLKLIEKQSLSSLSTENLYLEGDNLEVLKLLKNNYYGAIKLIYIDPPYNTGKDFLYEDRFVMDSFESDVVEGTQSVSGERYTINTRSTNRYHAKWLSMMYTRLKVSKELLSENGSIFISIDDNEQKNLKALCDEIFGDKNFVCMFNRKGSGGRQDSKHFAIVHEYILCYAKNIDKFISGKETKEDEKYPYMDEKNSRRYKLQLLRKWGENSKRSDRPNLYYPIQDPDGKDFYPMTNDGEGCWRWSKEKMEEEINNGRVEFKLKEGTWVAYERIYEPKEDELNTKLYTTWIDNIGSSTGASLIKDMFTDKVFSYPKPVELIERILQLGNTKGDDIILDFFSGSATTAHAVMQANINDGGKRKFIMVQLPEECDKESVAYKQGYINICEVGKERIRRAAKRLEEVISNDRKKDTIDLGFKVFRVGNTNIRWNYEDIKSQTSNLLQQETQLQIAATQQMSNTQLDIASMMSDKDKLDFMPGFTDIDVVYELLLRQRDIPLSAKVEQLEGVGKRTYLFAQSYLVCLETEITTELLEKIAALQPLPIKFIFRDSAFEDDINLKDETIRRFKAFVARNKGEKQSAYTVEFI